MSRLVVYASAVIALNAAGWSALLLLVGPRHPALVGLGVLAFTFGLRHAFDADHLAAIDNTTRRLLQERRPAQGTGFYFSVGHSTIVVLLTIAIGLSARWAVGSLPALRQVGGVLGTSLSGAFLLLIAAVNLGVLLDIWRAFQGMRTTEQDAAELERRLMERGLLNRVLGRFARLVRSDRDMYRVGLLFGLGFDTTSEVALLAISAGAASRHVPMLTVLILPLLFAAGMTLMDTLDGAFMAGAYQWAFTSPLRKTYYNLVVTGMSVAVALLVGAVEAAQVIGGELRLSTGFWGQVQALNFQTLGYIIAALFVVTWAGAYGIWKVGRVEERWGRGQ